MSERASRPGRRPGNPNTRETILRAARELFANQGFDNVTVRQIAAQAGVDPALIYHYFDTKEHLFLEVIQFPLDPAIVLARILEGDPAGIPERLVQLYLFAWDDPQTGQAMRSLFRRATSDPQTSHLMREFFISQIVTVMRKAIGEHIAPDELPIRASLVASQLLGLALVRYVIELEALTSATPDTLVDAVAPTIARYLFDDDLPLPARDTTP